MNHHRANRKTVAVRREPRVIAFGRIRFTKTLREAPEQKATTVARSYLPVAGGRQVHT